MVGGEHAAVRHARAPVLELDHAANLGGERFADRVEQPGKRRVVGRLPRPRMRRADFPDFREIVLDGLDLLVWHGVGAWSAGARDVVLIGSTVANTGMACQSPRHRQENLLKLS